MKIPAAKSYAPPSRLGRVQKTFRLHWPLYAILVIPLAWLILFNYVPMYGLNLAFRKYNALTGINGGEWMGLHYFDMFFTSPNSWKYLWNTFALSLYSTILGFLPPLVLAICLNEVKGRFFKKTVQMITYIPYFISTVVLVGMLLQLLDLRNGIFNQIITLFGGNAQNWMGEPENFRMIYVLSGIWQTTGYNSIVYLAALTAVNPELQEAAIIDGASRMQRILHVDIPCISSTIITLFILGVGFTMSIGFEKVYLMQNPTNTSVSEIISTYVYKVGLIQNNFSYSTAIGMFNSIINLVLMMFVNFLSKKFTQNGIW